MMSASDTRSEPNLRLHAEVPCPTGGKAFAAEIVENGLFVEGVCPHMTAAGDKIAGAQMMQGIELIVVELPASGDERALIGGGRDHLPEQGVVLGLGRRRRQQPALHPCQTFLLDQRQPQLRTGYYRDPQALNLSSSRPLTLPTA